jgi:hypothetical protein
MLAERADEAIQGHGGDMTNHRSPLQAQSTMGGQQSITGHLRPHLAIPQDELWEDREHRFARRTLYPPDGHPTQANTHIMGVARQAPAAATGGFVLELKAKGQDEGEDTFEECLAIAQQLEVRRFTPEIHSDGAVFTGLAGCVSHGHPQVRWSL